MKVSRAYLNDWVVLIVDDHADNLRVAEHALKFHGAQVHTATNGRDGIDKLKKLHPTLILLDLSMPVMNGWDMFDWIKRSRRFSKIPVVAVTAHAMSDDRQKVLDKGFDGYIPKPYDILGLVTQLQEIVAKAVAEKVS